MRKISLIPWLLILLVIPLGLTGCGVVGADIRLENLNLGALDMDGKPLSGLPSDKINISLDVAAQTIKVHTTANGTVLTVMPSGATVTVSGDTVSFKGLKPEQVKIEWAVKPAD